MKGGTLVPNPSHARNATDSGVGKDVKGSGRKVEVSDGATHASVCESDDDALALVCGVGK